MPAQLFNSAPGRWENIPLPEPVHVEAGKHYEVGVDGSAAYLREVAEGGITFKTDGTVTAVYVFPSPPMGALFEPDQY